MATRKPKKQAKSRSKSKPAKKAKASKKLKAKAKSAKASAKVSEDLVPKLQEGVLARKNVDGSVAIMRLDTDSHFFVLDGIAAELWQMIDGKATLGEIKEKLETRYNPPKPRFDRDVSGLVRDLRKNRLLD